MNLNTFFQHHEILLLDGATGSQLIARGMKAGECPELWNVTHPEKVQEIAHSYFEAGSDAVLTNTFGGSALKLSDYGLQHRVRELNMAGAANALKVKPVGKLVLGSIGPSGKMLEPYGDSTEEDVVSSFAIQAATLAEGGVDGFVLETFLDFRELMCAISAVRQVSSLPFLASLTYTVTINGIFTIMGNAVPEAVEGLKNAGPFAMGSNCGNGIANMIAVGQAIRAAMPAGILLLKPNAGEPVIRDGVTCYTESAENFEKHFQELASLKPLVLGGCCGTGPDHIRILRQLIDLANY